MAPPAGEYESDENADDDERRHQQRRSVHAFNYLASAAGRPTLARGH